VISLAIGDGALNTAQDAIEFTLTAKEQKYDVKSNTAVGEAYDIVTDTDKKFVLNKTILDNWYNKAAIELKDSVANNKATLSLSGTGTGTAKNVVITGGTNISIKDSTDGFEISATDTNTTYDMVSPEKEAKIHLDSSVGDNDAGTVEFKAGTDLEVDGTNEGEISYRHKTYADKAEVITAQQNPQQGTSFNIVSGVTTSNGHVTDVHTQKVQLPEITNVNVGNDGKINIIVSDGAGDEKTNKTISSDATGLKVGTTLVPLGGDLKEHFYTETEIDTKFADHLKSVNAMVFKGSVPSTGLPSGNDAVSIGDTYIMASGSGSVTQEGTTAAMGDILIAYSATGAEEADGYIASENIKWTLVPGNEEDTTYEIGTDSNKIILTSSVAGDSTEIAVSGDDAVSLTASEDKLQAAHAVINNDGLSTF
jgi:hypothetical protein